MGRPAVDVVTPFAGTAGELEAACARLARLDLEPGDTVTVADNRAAAPTAPAAARNGRVQVIAAAERRSSYHARNRGAATGSNPWIVFLDADVEPAPDLLARCFDPLPDERTAVLAAAIVDEPPAADAPFAVRYSAERGTLDHRKTLAAPRPYAQTACCAVRRTAFDAVGGFRADLRSGGDADLCFRLADAGWRLEARDEARVVHRSRPTLAKLVRQRIRHGSGAGWLERHYPGSAPGHPNLPGLVKWSLQTAAVEGARYARGDRDQAPLALADIVVIWAMELGRLLPNEVRR